MKIICIVESLYSLLIFLLIKDPDINLKDTFLITSGKEYKFLKNKFNQTIFLKKYQNRYLKIFNKIKYFIYFFILEIIYNLKNKLVYGNDHTTGAFYFLRKYTFIVIEDGLINYNKDIYIKNYCKYRKYILSFPMFGQYKTVKKIYLTGLAPIPEKIKSKVEIINLKELWNKKKINEQKEILNLFGFNPIIIKNIKNRKLILFTQPLSEDNLITEEEKIKIYSKIIAN